jgi:hypothetical protein
LPKELPLIYSIHTICNDFSPAQLEYCLKQTYSNVKWFILDDSTNLEMITQIDNFVKQNKNIEIIRRPIEHVKQWRTRGGAIKYFVDNIKEFGLIPDYIALNDSTNLFEKDFLEKNLRFFYSSANNGDLVAVQEKYLSYPGGTLFSKYLYPLEELVNYNTNLYANFGATCNEFYLTGTLIKYNAFKEVPLTIVNNASPDTCSSFFMLKNNKKILFSNLGSTYKLRPLNYNDRKNQLLKWNNAHINAIKKRF